MASKSAHVFALPSGHVLNDYRILAVLGHGGFGITYLAEDTKLRMQVAIKEYLPNEIAVRADGLTVRSKSSDDDGDFQWGLDRFLREAQTLARFKHPNIIGVRRYFEAHGTAYMVMDYEDGESLSDVLNERPDMSEAEIGRLLFPLLDGLETVHKGQTLHRDIKPGNIYVRRDGTPVLLDFGAARTAIGRRSASLNKVFTPGYAPAEQYETDGEQGPWTDIYAMAAVLYRIIGGEAPPEATKRTGAMARKQRDPMRPAIQVGEGRFSHGFLEAIDWALSVVEDERPRSIAEWRAALRSGQAETARPAVAPIAAQPRPVPAEPAKAERIVSRPRPAAPALAEAETVRDQVPAARHPAGAAPTRSDQTLGQPHVSVPQPATPGKGRGLLFGLIGGGVVVLAAIGAVAYFLLNPGGFDPTRDVWIVDPAGKGNSTTIADAILRAPPKSRIAIKPGVYREPLVIGKELHIGSDAQSNAVPIIEVNTEACVQYNAPDGSLKNISFRRTGVGNTPCINATAGALLLEQVEIVNSNGPGLQAMPGSRPKIVKSRIHDSQNGVLIENVNAWARIEDSEIYNNKSSGVVVRANATGEIVGNRIYANTDHGVFVADGAKPRIENNQFERNTLAHVGVMLNGDPIVAGNKMFDGKDAGIYVWQFGKGRYENNEIARNGKSNVTVNTDADPVVIGNKIYNSTDAGIFVLNRAKGRYENNEIWDNKDAGIRVQGNANPVVIGNKIRNGKSNGILVTDRATGSFENNEIFANDSAGISVLNVANPRFTGNKIHSGKKTGIFVADGGLGRFERNEIYRNGFSGIQVKTKANPFFSANRIYDGVEHGIWVLEEGRGYFENNEIFRNRMVGLEVTQVSAPVAVNNRIYQNLQAQIRRATESLGTYTNNFEQ
ncbi:MAG: right-handed parallel beta-helix repeat-containing protein [Alphaproteobacteria bacterium]